LDAAGHSLNDPVNDELMAGIRQKVDSVAASIRQNSFSCDHDHAGDSSMGDLGWLMKAGHKPST
jgi:hypothetical protein